MGLPSGADQPFYRILPDEEDVEAFSGLAASAAPSMWPRKIPHAATMGGREWQ